LFIHSGKLYESTGLRGQSTLREVDRKSGLVLRQHRLKPQLFAEGATLFWDKLYQLTWEAGICLIYDPKTFKPMGSFRYRGEGWGLTHDENSLIMSNGTAKISFINPESYQVRRTITVKHKDRLLPDLNELEYVDGFIYANVWYRDIVVKIEPITGEVVGVIDFSDLWQGDKRHKDQVLNGIAYDEKKKTFLITGKFWPKLFEVRLQSVE